MNKEHSNRMLLGLQFLLAALFLFFGIRKLIGDGAAVQTFSEIGAGQWLRYLVGTLEISGAIGLLIPRLSGLAAIGLAGVMAGAVATEIFLIPDGNPVTPMVLLAMAATVAWFRRDRTIALLENGASVVSATVVDADGGDTPDSPRAGSLGD